MNRPDYDNSILSVSSSMLKYYGIDCGHPSQPIVDKSLSRNPRTAAIMLFDGMGVNLLEKHLPEDAFLRRYMKSTISSVFPPTTVAATTAIQSGMTPAEHGWLGWTLYFKEVKDNVTVFPNKLESTGKKASNKNLAETLMSYRNICTQIHEACPDVDAETVSLQNGARIFSIGSACRRVLHISRRPGRHFIYCYWINPDHLIHKYGTNSKQVHRTILKINREAEKMYQKLNDTTAVILADHGLIDTKWKYLEDYPELCNMLIRNPSIENRAYSFFIKNGKQEAFENAFNSIFKDEYILLKKEEVLKMHLFGEGKENPRFREFIGDYLAVAVSDCSIAMHRRKHTMKGIHAGLTKEELTVPLIILEK